MGRLINTRYHCDSSVWWHEKFGELLAKYRLSMTEVELGTEEVEQEGIWLGKKPLTILFNAVAEFTGCRCWMQNDSVGLGVAAGGHKRSYHGKAATFFFGLKHDVEVAKYLFVLCSRAIDQELKVYKRLQQYLDEDPFWTRQAKTLDFRRSTAQGLAARLRQMAKAHQPDLKTSTGKALVPVRNAVLDKAMEERGINLKTVRTRRLGGSSQAGFGAPNASASIPASVRPRHRPRL